MLTSIKDVIDKYHQKYQELPDELHLVEFLLPEPGYSPEEIAHVENSLTITLHRSLRDILMTVNLDTVSFHNLCFGCGRQYLRFLVDPTNHCALQMGYVLVARVGVHMIEMDNRTGEIYYYVMPDCEKKTYLLPDMTTLICLAATIALHPWPPLWADYEVQRQAAEQFLQDNHITIGYDFWWLVILGQA